MGRWLLLVAVVISGCRFDPAGTCDTRADCPAGLDCLSGVCAACRDDGDCAEWQACGLDGLCATADGRCGEDAECASWEACGAAHLCALRSDHCADDAACDPGALEVCDPAHHCSLPGGVCLAAPDCPPWMSGCDTGAKVCLFPATAGEDVLAIGTLGEGDCTRGAVARATTSAASSGVVVGLGCGSAPDGRASLDPVTGEVVYRFTEPAWGDTLRRVRADALEWDDAAGLWRFPPAPAENDDVALAPGACPITWNGWIMQAGTGALLYACPVSGGALRDYHDAADAVRLQAVQETLAWSASDHLLVRSATGVLQVVDAAGIATGVTLLPDGRVLATRSTSTGFRVAVDVAATGDVELHAIDESTGIAIQEGTHASVAGTWPGGEWTTLDADGALHGGGPFGDLLYEIVRRPLQPDPAALVYAEGAMPAGSNDPSAAAFEPFLRLDRLLLVTRP